MDGGHGKKKMQTKVIFSQWWEMETSMDFASWRKKDSMMVNGGS